MRRVDFRVFCESPPQIAVQDSLSYSEALVTVREGRGWKGGHVGRLRKPNCVGKTKLRQRKATIDYNRLPTIWDAASLHTKRTA